MAAITLRYLFGSFNFGRSLGWLFYIILPIVLHELLHNRALNPAALILIISLGLIPLALSIAGLVFDLRQLHAPMVQLHKLYGLGGKRLRRLNLLVLQAAFLVSCLPLATVLVLHGQSLRAMFALPIGMLALAAFIHLNDRKLN